MKRHFVLAAASLWLALNAMAADDPSKVADIDGVHYTGVAWGPIKNGKAMMITDQGTRWIELDKLPERVARSYGLRGGSINFTIPANPLMPGGASAAPASAAAVSNAGKTRITEEEGWKVVARFVGGGEMSTAPFDVAAAPWRLRWHAISTSLSADGFFHVIISRPGRTEATGRADGMPSGSTYCYDTGAFYLQISTFMTQYEIVAEERATHDRTAAASASSAAPIPAPVPVPAATPAPAVPGAAPAVPGSPGAPAMPETPGQQRTPVPAAPGMSRAAFAAAPAPLTVARLGDSEKEIAGRFGPPRKTMAGNGPGKTLFLYFRDAYSTSIEFQDGRAVCITVARVDEDVIHPSDLTAILKANEAGQRWDPETRRQLRRADGACAQLNESGTRLTLSAPGFVVFLQPGNK